MTETFSKTQIDKLGERLKRDHASEDDLQMLAEYRTSFSEAFQFVSKAIQKDVTDEVSGRMKTNASTIAKLRRESIRLSQIQDMVGCRIIVSDIIAQNYATQALVDIFSKVTVIDRREKPSYGYRAVHIIARFQERQIEIQIRTSLQHLWAELSEKLFDVYPEIKYGGGAEIFKNLLDQTSIAVSKFEEYEVSTSTSNLTTAKQFYINVLRLMAETLPLLVDRRSKESNVISD